MSAPDDNSLWTVVATRVAKREGRKILRPAGYEHTKEVLKRLVYWPRKSEIVDLDIVAIRDVFELRDKGGPIGRNINLRVYFGAIPAKKEIVILKTYKKEQEHQTPDHIIELVEDRFDDYKEGLLVHGNSYWLPEDELRNNEE